MLNCRRNLFDAFHWSISGISITSFSSTTTTFQSSQIDFFREGNLDGCGYLCNRLSFLAWFFFCWLTVSCISRKRFAGTHTHTHIPTVCIIPSMAVSCFLPIFLYYTLLLIGFYFSTHLVLARKQLRERIWYMPHSENWMWWSVMLWRS